MKSKISGFDIEHVRNVVARCSSMRELLRQLEYKSSGDNKQTIQRYFVANSSIFKIDRGRWVIPSASVLFLGFSNALNFGWCFA
jgi:hypothetical protein